MATGFRNGIGLLNCPKCSPGDRDVPRAEVVIITQFCRDWRSWPEDREWMLEGEPGPAGDPYDLAKVAAVVPRVVRTLGPSDPRLDRRRPRSDRNTPIPRQGPPGQPGVRGDPSGACAARLREAWRLLRSRHAGVQGGSVPAAPPEDTFR